jgi:sulfonate transport system substrate-binding protein
MKFKKWVVAILAAGSMVITAACAGASGAGDEAKAQLNTATVINVAYSETNPIGKAIDEAMGFSKEVFDGTGITVNWTSGLGTGSETIAALTGGSVDFANLGEFPVVTSYGNDVKEFKLVAYNRYENDVRIIVPADSDIVSVTDLKGKKIGVAIGTGSQLFLLQELDKAGISADEVEIVNLGNSAWQAAYENGEIDAECSSTTSTQRYITDGSSKELVLGAESLNVIVARNAFLEQNPDIAKKVVAMYQKIFAYVSENPAEAAKIVAEASGQNVDAVQEQFERLENKTTVEFEQQDYEYLSDVKEFALAQGLITKDFDVSEVVDFSYLK